MNIRSITAGNPGAFTLDGTRSYLLGDRAVIDPGPNLEQHVRALADAAPRLELIFITHRHADHAPAAIPLKQITGARVVAPVGTLPGNEIDVVVKGGERFAVAGGALEVLATPGHTCEHVCYLTGDGDLFTGDTILGAGTTAIFPPDGDMAAYLHSLQMLRARGPRRIFPGHGPVRDDAVALIDEYIAHRLQREQQILDAVAAGAMSIDELRARVYPDLDPSLVGAAEAQLRAHLAKLRNEGRLEARHPVIRSHLIRMLTCVTHATMFWTWQR